MPEGLEAEIYRRAIAPLVGARITDVVVDGSCGDQVALASLVGGRLAEVHRLGKNVLLSTTRGVLGVHFGMTGRVVVDGVAPIAELEYGSGRDDHRWDRLVVRFGNRVLRVNDPRRWSRYVLEPDLSRLGVDLASPLAQLRGALDAVSHRSTAVKSVLLDQSVIAGLGNLLADEVCLDAEVDPRRSFRSLDVTARAALARSVSQVVRRLGRRGGSHTGVLGPPARTGDGRCDAHDAVFERAQVGGRTTFWCPMCQR